MVIVSLACLWVTFVPVQLGSGRTLAWIMQDCGNLHIFQHYSLFLCRLRTPFIEWFPNDVGNECFMRGPGQNILILLSKADTGLAGGGEPCWSYLQSLLIIYGSQAHEQFLNGLRYITTLIYIIAPSTPTLRRGEERPAQAFTITTQGNQSLKWKLKKKKHLNIQSRRLNSCVQIKGHQWHLVKF